MQQRCTICRYAAVRFVFAVTPCLLVLEYFILRTTTLCRQLHRTANVAHHRSPRSYRFCRFSPVSHVRRVGTSYRPTVMSECESYRPLPTPHRTWRAGTLATSTTPSRLSMQWMKGRHLCLPLHRLGGVGEVGPAGAIATATEERAIWMSKMLCRWSTHE